MIRINQSGREIPRVLHLHTPALLRDHQSPKPSPRFSVATAYEPTPNRPFSCSPTLKSTHLRNPAPIASKQRQSQNCGSRKCPTRRVPEQIDKARVRAHRAGCDGGRGCSHGEPARGRDGLRHFSTASAGRASPLGSKPERASAANTGTEISRWVREREKEKSSAGFLERKGLSPV
jgi:hypothetical protein